MGAHTLTACAVLALLIHTAAAAYSGSVATEAQLRSAVAQGGQATLAAPITLTGGELVLTSILSIDGANLTIDAGGNSRIFNVKAGGSLYATSLTLSNAKSNGSGGAMLVAGTVALDSPVFTNNQALGVLSGGGAIAVTGSSGSLVVRGGSFSGNTANFGGAIDVESSAKADIGFSTFSNNKAVTSGGAIQVLDAGSLLLSEEDDTVAPGTPNTFTGNTAPLGGAIMIDQAVAQICGFRGSSNAATNGGPNIYLTAAQNSSLTFFDFPASFVTAAPGAKAPVNQPFLGCPPLSVTPAPVPTAAPTIAPTVAPTVIPTIAPAPAPKIAPAPAPTVAPTPAPTVAPTVVPTVAPTVAPIIAPAPAQSVAAAAPAPAPAATPVPSTASPLTAAPTKPPVTAPAPSVAPAPAPVATPSTTSASTQPPATPPPGTPAPIGTPATTSAPPVNPCRNGGTPLVLSGQTGCQCPNTFTGPLCEVPVLANNPYTTF